MIENIPTIFKAIATAASGLKAFTDWRSQTKGDSRAIIEELKENSRYFWLVLEDDSAIDKIISQLDTKEYDRLCKSGFDFNALQRKKIAVYPSLNGTDMASWQGKETEQLLSNIYDKIKDLKIQYRYSKTNKKILWKQRVKNIQKRILLLLLHARN